MVYKSTLLAGGLGLCLLLGAGCAHHNQSNSCNRPAIVQSVPIAKPACCPTPGCPTPGCGAQLPPPPPGGAPIVAPPGVTPPGYAPPAYAPPPVAPPSPNPVFMPSSKTGVIVPQY